MQITFANVISNRINDDVLGWRDMLNTERERYLTQFKEFLLSTCKSSSDTAKSIRHLKTHRLPSNCGLFTRLVIDSYGVEYTAGQDYPGELREIKRLIKKGGR